MKLRNIAILAASILLAGCATSAIIATSITGVSEVAASNLIQKKLVTVAQLNTLATDLSTFAANPSVALPSADSGIVANLVTEIVAKRSASLTQESVVDACNKAIASLSAATSTSPTAWQGIAWADLMDIVGGLKQAVTNVQANPSLAPTALYSKPQVTETGLYAATVFVR